MDLSDTSSDSSFEETQSGSGENIAGPMMVLQGVQNWVRNWVPLAAALLSLILAIVSLVVATHDPGVVIILPSRVIMDDADLGADTPFRPANLYIQPNFVGTGNNNRIELVTSISLALQAVDGGPSATSEWNQQGRWDFTEGTIDAAGFSIPARAFVYLADAAPLLVSPNNAQQPLCVFPIPVGFEIKPDTKYRLTLTADRAVADKPLTAIGEFSVTKEQINIFKENYRALKFTDTRLEMIGP